MNLLAALRKFWWQDTPDAMQRKVINAAAAHQMWIKVKHDVRREIAGGNVSVIGGAESLARFACAINKALYSSEDFR